MDLFSYRRHAETLGAPRAGGLYHQDVICAAMKRLGQGQAVSDIGQLLVSVVEQAYVFRKMEAVEQISSALIGLNFPQEFRVIGRYFQALCLRQDSEDGVQRSTALLENVVERAPDHYRAKALLSLGTNATNARDLSSGLKLYFDAASVAVGEWRDSETAVQAQKMLAVVSSIAGDHRGALASLEALYPIARRVGSLHPHLYYDYLNSLAVELGEAGRIQEASNVAKLVVASPFAHAYPEWSETRDEIARRGRGGSRSFVHLPVASPEPAKILLAPAVARDKVLVRSRLPDGGTPAESEANNGPTARLLVFPERKVRPAQAEGTSFHQQPDSERGDGTSALEKRAAVARLLFEKDSPSVVNRMLEAVGLVSPDGDDLPSSLDLDSPGELEELIRRWLNGAIEPEELAAVLSALRDCEDDLQRTNILDQMISIAFVETMQHYESERDWRKRVEARLIPFGADSV